MDWAALAAAVGVFLAKLFSNINCMFTLNCSLSPKCLVTSSVQGDVGIIRMRTTACNSTWTQLCTRDDRVMIFFKGITASLGTYL